MPAGRRKRLRAIPHTSKSIVSTPAAFRQFKLDERIGRGIAAAGFEEPRPVQARTIPATLEGRDVLGLAQTGTGKTAAFALPILQRLVSRRRQGPRALVVAPTRELAIQIHAEIELLGKYTNARAITVFGGVNANPQIAALKKRPDIIVACPGRLLDLLQQRHVDLSSIEVLVLDEADHMFDMGFLPDVRRILRALPARRQNLLFSATMPREIRGLADQTLDRPHVVELAHSTPAGTIDHALYPVSQKRKIALLGHIMEAPDFRSAIVFLRTKRRARQLARDLDSMGHRAIALQGNMSQGQRDRAMKGFREGRYDVLVATDIAARGIDVANVSHVINFDVPSTPDAYTHRIGRTGRAEKTGKACTFVTSEDHDMIRAIEKHLGSRIEQRVVEGFSGEAVGAHSGERRRSAGTSRPGARRRATTGLANGRGANPRSKNAKARKRRSSAQPKAAITRRTAARPQLTQAKPAKRHNPGSERAFGVGV